jgi:hypothetical protein
MFWVLHMLIIFGIIEMEKTFILFYWKESILDSYIFILIFLYHKGNIILDSNLRITNNFNISWVLAFVT